MTNDTVTITQARPRMRAAPPGRAPSFVHSRAGSMFPAFSIAVAAACADVSPADDALVSTLSSDELVALCDELRDEITVDDRPARCGDSEVYWLLPSNQTCRELERSACNATAGEVRSWYEAGRRDPCTTTTGSIVPYGYTYRYDFTNGVGTPTPNLTFAFPLGCESLAPSTLPLEVPNCGVVQLSSLQSYDGVYSVSSIAASSESCGAALPALLDAGAPRFVLVSTQASGVSEVILESCDTVADCQRLARELREAGDPGGTARDAYRYNHFSNCSTPADLSALPLQSRWPEGARDCERQWLPSASITQVEPSTIRVSIDARGGRAEASPGCGYVVMSSLAEYELCSTRAEYTAFLEAPL